MLKLRSLPHPPPPQKKLKSIHLIIQMSYQFNSSWKHFISVISTNFNSMDKLHITHVRYYVVENFIQISNVHSFNPLSFSFRDFGQKLNFNDASPSLQGASAWFESLAFLEVTTLSFQVQSFKKIFVINFSRLARFPT